MNNLVEVGRTEFFAVADAVRALSIRPSNLRVVSVGVGNYPEPKRWLIPRLLRRFPLVQLVQKTLDINAASMEQLRSILFTDVPAVRINDTFNRPELATDLMEHDLRKLNMLLQQGKESFAKHEADLVALLAFPPDAPASRAQN